MKRQNKLLHLPPSERRLLVEAAMWLIAARLAIIFPFRWIALFLGSHMAESLDTDEPEHKEIRKQISWAVQSASRHLPLECTCMVQAIAGKAMLKRRGIQSTLYLGLAMDREKNLEAHAWLRSGEVIVIGAQGIDQFTVISTFAGNKH
jgi:hypothetical protein